jgi:hypothetical protein
LKIAPAMPEEVQMGSFKNTDGMFKGFKIDAAAGYTNWNQTGDWVRCLALLKDNELRTTRRES